MRDTPRTRELNNNKLHYTDSINDKQTLQQYYEQAKKQENEINKLRRSQQQKLFDEEKKHKSTLIEDMYKKELELGIKSDKERYEFEQQYIADNMESERLQKEINIKKYYEDEKKKKLALEEEYWSLYKKKSKSQLEEEKKQRLAQEINIKRGQADALKEQAKKETDPTKKAELEQKAKQLEKEANKAEDKQVWTDAFSEQFKDFKEALENDNKYVADTFAKNITQLGKQLGKNITEGLNQVNTAIESYSSYQLQLNTRLQGASSFSEAVETLDAVSNSPLLSASDLYSNLNELVNEGIVTNVEQRAFFMTIKDGIATTFDANSTYIKNLIKIQQSDSTAIRLGMESYLTKWLNAYVENTEYLTTTFDNVADALYNASALMTSYESAEFEYIVQKWLGALSGVGFSSTTINNIANAIGQLGSGDFESLSSSEIQNLMIMAATKANLSYTSLLSGNIGASETNKLLASLVSYLKDLNNQSSNNNILASSLASAFGVNITDLKAVSNLTTNDIQTIYNSALTANDMYTELKTSISTLADREGISKLMSNALANLTFQTGYDIANNSGTYAAWAISDLIQSVTGGINIPFITTLGTGIDLETTVENLVKIGIVGANMLGNIGDLVASVANINSSDYLLDALKVKAVDITERGEGLQDYIITDSTYKKSLSKSMTLTNTNSDDIYRSTINSGYDDAKQLSGYDDADTEDKAVQYLKDISFEQKFNSIVDNIESIKNDGIAVNNINTISDSITGLFTANRS